MFRSMWFNKEVVKKIEEFMHKYKVSFNNAVNQLIQRGAESGKE